MHAAAQIQADFPVTNSYAAARSRLSTLSFYCSEAKIYAQGEPSGTLYRVEYGAVRVYRLLADGRRQIVAFHMAGETFGFEVRHTRGFFADAMVGTRLEELECKYGDAPSEVTMAALCVMVRAQEHLLVVGRQNAIERVSTFLVDMILRQGGDQQIDLPMSRLDIADYLGMTIETVSRTLSGLKQKGVIRLPTLRCVEVVRLASLRRLCA
jgi:CRP/FNR family nitrogen fixation transcriptional regulator